VGTAEAQTSADKKPHRRYCVCGLAHCSYALMLAFLWYFICEVTSSNSGLRHTTTTHL